MRYESIESGLYQAREWARDVLEKMAAPLARLLARLKVTPNQVSTAGFALNVVAAMCIATNDLALAGVIYIVAGGLDLMDGTLARVTGRATKFGAFFDSTVDRISEGVVFAAITYRFAIDGESVLAAVVVLALLGSLLVSYVRARAEGLGGKCKVGLLTRAERVILLTLGLLFGLLAHTIVLLAVLTAVTVAQRIYYVAKQFDPLPKRDEAASEPS
ncbi:CDP-alcohol phosphatidyltransferase family protein [Shumkonia mesophila]|uniref:CDP-alcohol phosphatidyltransferase family protein n=1 Tax=Shumkonia mesophila TaxID=2838854 RepID=UPI002934700A|nr:CDP-alcohol phosphatidyltransferase family protein [Shumkonia mesophila]